MGMGYLSLFYEDAPIETNIQAVKDSIYDNYKLVLTKPPKEDEKQNLIDIIQNTVLQDIQSLMQKKIEEGQAEAPQIAYWEINMQTANAYIRQASTEVEQIGKTLEYIQQMYNQVSDAISKGKGVVSSGMIAELESCKNSLTNLAASFGEKVDKRGFESAFNGSVGGIVRKVQGALHEAAGALAGALAQKKINEALQKTNNNIQVIVEQTGGKLLADSQIAGAAQKGKFDLGRSNNAKNDLTIIITGDDGAQLLWHSGLSLKSTSSNAPNKVHIMTTSLGTLLNKFYNQQTYLDLAAALGTGDWNNSSGIDALAEQHNISMSGTALHKQWKEIVHAVIYDQLINMFTGIKQGGILNDAQYLLLNSRVISMYEIFEALEKAKNMLKNGGSVWSIPGIELGGIIKADNRSQFTQINVNSFAPLKIGRNPEGARIERSTEAWSRVSAALQDTKIRISLKFAQLGLTN